MKTPKESHHREMAADQTEGCDIQYSRVRRGRNIVTKDPKKTGNSASDENQKDMEDIVKNEKNKIDTFAKSTIKRVSGDTPADNAESLENGISNFLKDEYQEMLKREAKKKEKGDTGPSL